MTEATGREMTSELKRWLETWKSGVQEVISQVAGQSLSLSTSEEALPSLPDDVWYTVTSAGAVSGEMTLKLSAASGSILGQILLGEPQPAAGELTAERKEALDELLRQIAGQVATALSSPAEEVQLCMSQPPPRRPGLPQSPSASRKRAKLDLLSLSRFR